MSWSCDLCGGDRHSCKCTPGDFSLVKIEDRLAELVKLLKPLVQEIKKRTIKSDQERGEDE